MEGKSYHFEIGTTDGVREYLIRVQGDTAEIIPQISHGEEDMVEAQTVHGQNPNEALALAKQLLIAHHQGIDQKCYPTMREVKPGGN